MKTITIASILVHFLFLDIAQAQQNFDFNATDIAAGPGVMYAINGQSFSRERFSNLVEGSPFFNSEFMKGNLVLEGGRMLKNFSVKVNLLDGTVNYLNEKNEELEATISIREVFLTDVLTNKETRFVHSKYICNGAGKTWYRIVDSGAVSLYVNEVRVMTESKSYGSATLQQTVHKDPYYIVVSGTECTRVKSAAELAGKLISIDPGFQQKIAGLKLKGKSEKDLLELVRMYNSTHTGL